MKTIFVASAIYFLGLVTLHLENKGIICTLGIPINAYQASYESKYWALHCSKVKIYTQNELAFQEIKTTHYYKMWVQFISLCSLNQ
jgi:hypothetical protein